MSAKLKPGVLEAVGKALNTITKYEAATANDREMRAWGLGFAEAVASLIRIYDLPTVADGVTASCGLSLKRFREIGVSEFNMKQLRKMGRQKGGRR